MPCSSFANSAGNAVLFGEKTSYFVFRQYGWHAFGLLRPPNVVQAWQIDIWHFALQEQQSTERFVMGGSRCLALCGHHGEEGLHLRHTHIARMSHTCPLGGDPANDKTYPIKVNLLGYKSIVQVTNPLLHLIEQAGRFQRRSAGFHEKIIPVYKHSI